MGKKKGLLSKKKSMKKSVAIFWLTVLSMLMIVASVFTFIRFEVGVYDYSLLDAIKLGIDLKGGFYAVLEPDPKLPEDASDADKQAAVEKINASIDSAVEILRDRLTAKGYPEATVVAQYSLGDKTSSDVTRIRVEIPDVEDADDVLSIIGQTAKLEFHDSNADNNNNIGAEATGAIIQDAQGRHLGDHVSKANLAYDENGNPVVALKFDSVGTKIFADKTSELVSSNGVIVIALDGKIISAPTVQAAITGGEATITNMGSVEAAQNLAMQINSGSIPMTFQPIEPRYISPTLGEDALKNSLIAGGIGLLLVFIFMAFMYRGFGLIADLALIIYTLIVMFFLAVLPWVQLTIEGIAGIILSIGMAVDANVIIFERIKDEYKGKCEDGEVFTPKIEDCIRVGFRRAIPAILDSNITTIIASVVLWVLGTGSIKGFGVTLFIGIVISMFTALFITRLLVKLFLPITKSEKFYRLKRGSFESKKNAAAEVAAQ